MNSALERLLSLRVADVMNNEVTTLRPRQTMIEAAKILAAEMISGAPVVDDSGRCIGMLTATDFLHEQSGVVSNSRNLVVVAAGEDRAEPEPGDRSTVATWMAADVQTVPASATILSAARQMCGSHIHRLVVLDGQGRPVGMISTLDLVSSLVLAFEE